MIEPIVRIAQKADLPACVAMVNDWIDRTPWHPRVHARSDVAGYYESVIWPEQKVLVIGSPPVGFLAITDDDFISALYAHPTRKGTGGALLQAAKTDRGALSLWTHQPNTIAQAFYLKHGFTEARRTDGDNEEGVPDILYRWRAQ